MGIIAHPLYGTGMMGATFAIPIGVALSRNSAMVPVKCRPRAAIVKPAVPLTTRPVVFHHINGT